MQANQLKKHENILLEQIGLLWKKVNHKFPQQKYTICHKKLYKKLEITHILTLSGLGPSHITRSSI
jgi:hypothetical protein